jgi:NHL repeat
VSDGYGNARVHKYSPDGKPLMSWGESGTEPGQFNLVHNISCDPDGWVYVADRENHRIQVFDGNGRYETQFNNLHRPCGIFMPYCTCPICYVGELGPATRTNRNYPNLGPRVSIIDNKGNLLARIGGQHPGTGPTDYIGPHGLCADSRGDIYIGEVSRTLWPQYFADQPIPDGVRCLRKLRKL